MKKGMLFVLALMTAVGIAGVQERETKESMVIVQGDAEVQAEPDQAIVRLGVSHVSSTAAQAQARVNDRMQAILQALQDLSVPANQIQTDSIFLNPNMSYDRGTARVTGYTASNTVSVTLYRLDQVGPVLDAATKLGGNEIRGVVFGLKDDAEAQQRALTKAVENAVSKAKTLSRALGKDLGRIVELSESSVRATPIYRQERVAMEQFADSTPVSPGQISVTASVTLKCVIE